MEDESGKVGFGGGLSMADCLLGFFLLLAMLSGRMEWNEYKKQRTSKQNVTNYNYKI
jgi:hypothetical protein